MKAKALPIIMKIASKVDAKPLVEKLKKLDLKSLDDGKKLSDEEVGILAAEIVSELLPQMGKVADDVIPLIAATKNITFEEAEDIELADALKDIFADEALISFFKSAWMKKQG